MPRPRVRAENDRPPFRVRAAAARLGVSDKAILAALKGGTLYGFRLTPDGPWLIPQESVDRLIRGETSAA